MIIKTNEVITVCGKRGSGKSFLMKKIIEKISNFILYDLNHEHNIKGAIISSDIRHFKQLLERGFKKIIYHPSSEDKKEFDYVCELVFATGNIMFFVDEADRLMDRWSLSVSVGKIINRGRHKGIGICCVTRRIADLNKSPVSQSHHIFVFQQFLPNDIKYLKEFIEIAEEAVNLKMYHYIYKSDGQARVCLPIVV